MHTPPKSSSNFWFVETTGNRGRSQTNRVQKMPIVKLWAEYGNAFTFAFGKLRPVRFSRD